MDPFRSWYQTQAPVRRSFSRSPNSFFGMPAHNVDPNRDTLHPAHQFQRPRSEERPTQKVVRIPVQFLRSKSESNRRSESAVKIQKVFRSFLVRNTLKKVREIESKVDEIEAKLRRSDVVEKIRRDEKERLRMNENLMNLLFKLDGIRGVDLGVRNCRKGVTKKAIALQEKVDSIEAIDSEADFQNQDEEICDADGSYTAAGLKGNSGSGGLESSADFTQNVGKSTEEIVHGGTDTVVEADVDKMGIEREQGEEMQVDDVIDAEITFEDSNNMEEREVAADESVEGLNGNGAMLCDSSVKDLAMEDAKFPVNTKVDDAGIGNASEETRAKKRFPMNVAFDEDEDEIVKDPEYQKTGPVFNAEHEVKEGNGRSSDCELLKKMTMENAKMMSMMTQLCERNETQLQMLNTLANRVDSLEKAYLCDKLKNRRKKMKKKPVAAAFCVEE